MRRALLVGIDNYPKLPLSGCTNDAKRMGHALAHDDDQTPNFDCKILLGPPSDITRSILKQNIEELFATDADVALFYFSGHGTRNIFGGYLVTQDANKWEEGISMYDILVLAHKAIIREIIIILDCCFSGEFGTEPLDKDYSAKLREGISILTASRHTEAAMEKEGQGVFTGLVCDALTGGAADICGNVTVASIYAYIDQALGAWDQRPLLKAHVSKLIPLRKCKSHIDIEILRLLPTYFPDPSGRYELNPSFEPTSENANRENTIIFGHLQKLRDARLLILDDAESLFDAAMNSKSCRLTPHGKFYCCLASSERL